MPGTYTQLLLHVVFSTRKRTPWITPDVSERLFPYIAGIVRKERATLLEIGGVTDHIHLCLRSRPDISLSNLMRALKARSSKWVHDTFPHLANFAWQEGYSAFSVSQSQEHAVREYILRQHDHHRRSDFQSELLALLRAHHIEFDERYLWD